MSDASVPPAHLRCSRRSEWGFESENGLDRVLVVSPHPDDAALSCAALLLAHPGATVATLFA